MVEYRFYQIDDSGKIVGLPVVTKCADDDEAVIHAGLIVSDLAIEIWVDARKVGFVPADVKS